MKTLPDEPARIRRAQANPHEFAPLYDHYAPRVYTFFRYRVDDAATAQDLTAQTFAQALADIARYRPERAPFAAWLFGIANHAASRHYRHAQHYPQEPLDTLAASVSDLPQPEHLVIAAETSASLTEAVARLDPRERELIALKFVAGLPNTDIAALTGQTASNVGVILYRAIQKLRRTLATEDITHDRA